MKRRTGNRPSGGKAPPGTPRKFQWRPLVGRLRWSEAGPGGMTRARSCLEGGPHHYEIVAHGHAQWKLSGNKALLPEPFIHWSLSVCQEHAELIETEHLRKQGPKKRRRTS